MKIKVSLDRSIEKNYFYTEGTQNENNVTKLYFEFPKEYEDFSKRIVFITEDGNFWDYVNNNQYEIKNNITKYDKVEAYLWLTKDNQDFRSQNFELNFYENENADNLVPTEEQLDGFATVLDVLELKINEVEELKNTIYQLQENVENALEDLDKKQQDYEQRFQAIDNKLGLKLDEVKANPFVKQVKYDNKSSTFTFIAYDNTQVVVDLPIEETVIDGGYDPETQELYLVLVSGQEIRIPATDLVNDYEGLETATIQILISADNKITAHIKGGSITENLLSQEVAAKLNKVIDLTPYITKQESYEVFYTKSEVDEMVKEIQETNEYQSEIIDQFKNEFKQITVSGDSIHITDAAELPIELVPYGEPVQEVIEEEKGITIEEESIYVDNVDTNKENSINIKGNTPTQETREGKNLYQIPNNYSATLNGITCRASEDGIITLNGTASDRSVCSFNNLPMPSKANQSYSLNIIYLSGSINGKVSIYNQDSNNGYSGFNVDLTNTNNTFYTTSYTKDLSMNVRGIIVNKDTILNNLKFKVQFVKGNTSDYDFEQYGAMPSVDYPSEVNVVDGEYNINISNDDSSQEQVYPLDTSEYPLYSENDYYYKSDGKWYVHNELGKYVFTGNENIAKSIEGFFMLFSGFDRNDTTIFCNILKNYKDYNEFISSDYGISILYSEVTHLYFRNKDISSVSELQSILKGNYFIYKLATPTETEITNTVLIEQLEALYNANLYETITNINSEGNTEVLPIIKLHYNFVTPAPSIDRPSEILTVSGGYNTELENEDASIINNLPLTLTNELLGEIVTLTEEEAKELNLDGAGKYRRTDYGRYVFTGDETFNAYPYGVNSYSTKVITDNLFKTDEVMVISNYFIGVSNDNRDASMKNKIYSAASATTIFGDTDFATVDEFQAFLKSLYNAGTPTETIYKLANPTYEKITDETELQQLSAYDKQVTFFGVNNINTFPTDDLVKAPLKIHATYSKSNKLTIQSLEDRLASLESQVTNLQDNQI